MQYSDQRKELIEKAIRFISRHLADQHILGKPVLFHSVRVGSYLYHRGFSADIVTAGYLHDIIEDTDFIETDLATEFGEKIASIVQANSKDASIKEKLEKHEELISRCVGHSEEAAIVKAADILDNYIFYSLENNQKGIDYCVNNSRLMLKNLKSKNYSDPIFKELENLT